MNRRIAIALIVSAAMAPAKTRREQLAEFAGQWTSSRADAITISVRGDKLQMTIRGIDHPRLAEVAEDGTVAWMGQTGKLAGDELRWGNGDVWKRKKAD